MTLGKCLYSEQNVGQRLYRYLEDNRRSCENSDELKEEEFCAQELWEKRVPESRLNYVQSIEMTGLNACEGMRWLDFSTEFLKFRLPE